MPYCSVLSVGREILLGQTLDTNACYLVSHMSELGYQIRKIMAVDDILEDIVRAIGELATDSEVVLVTGGLGPTPDDLTRQAFAQALDVELVFRPDLMEQIEQRFARFHRKPSPSNRVQAFIPAGAKALENSCGTAPGITGKIGACRLFFMPGVPREMKQMFAEQILPVLKRVGGAGRQRYMKCFHLHGVGESQVGEAIAEVRALSPECEIGTAVGEGVIVLRLMSFGVDLAEAKNSSLAAEEAFAKKFAGHIFSEDGLSLAECVVDLLRAKGRSLSLAESCTGGMIAADVVGVPGASNVLLESIVCYSNEAKLKRLAVEPVTLERYGAVSREVVVELARNSRKMSGADYALAVSGIAGPDGGTPEKPVGTVWLALAVDGGVYFQCSTFIGDRQANRRRSSNCALDLLRRVIAGQPLPQGCEYAAD